MSCYPSLVLVLLAAVLPGQRPKTAEQALERFEKVRADNEATRRRPASDLGRFADVAVTRVLLAEIERAVAASYRQTIVRALGGCRRDEPKGVVGALQKVMMGAKNSSLCDEAARSIGAQGEAGVAVLGEVLESSTGFHRTAACRGLERVISDSARDVLIKAVARAANRDRMAPLEALAKHPSSPPIDKVRVRLAGDKDYLIAAEAIEQLAIHDHPTVARLALLLSRRLSAKARASHHFAVLHGLLRQSDPRRVEPKHHKALLQHAALAQAPFGKRLITLWSAVLTDAKFAAFLQKEGAGHKQSAQRQVAARALALAPESGWPLATMALTGLLNDADDAVVRAAAQSLPSFGKKFAGPPLMALIAGGRDDGKSAAAVAINVLFGDDPGWHGLLLGHSQSRSPALSATALRLLKVCGADLKQQALDVAKKGLQHKVWTVRAAAIELVVALRMKAGVPLLIERYDREKTRLQQDVAQALEDLTSLRFQSGKAWRVWWKKEADRFAMAQPKKGDRKSDRGGAKAGTGATYWNLPVHSDRIAFVVDSSGSMRAPFGTGSTRLGEAQRQLALVLDKLPNKAKANIIAFQNDATAWGKKLQSLSSSRRKAGSEFAANLEARSGTNVHAALRLAFADPEVDTIFLLTDGRPSAGEILDTKQLAEEVARWNIGRSIRIHAVAIGQSSRMLEQLAQDSGGNYTVAR